jgi:hypothetical protein
MENERMKIGSRVRLKEEHKMHSRTYDKGHEFTIYNSSYRGWDLVDDTGNKIDECLFMEHKLELVN